MPTLAQALQDRPPRPVQAWIVTVVSSTPNTVQTSVGPVVNGLWGAAPVGKSVVVIRVDGIDIAIGLF